MKDFHETYLPLETFVNIVWNVTQLYGIVSILEIAATVGIVSLLV